MTPHALRQQWALEARDAEKSRDMVRAAFAHGCVHMIETIHPELKKMPGLPEDQTCQREKVMQTTSASR